jgi:DNA-binding NtrC family response regulator
MAKLHFLIVDDDEDICQYLSELLQLDGHRATSVSDPLQAIDRLRADEFQICILDLMMPNMSGLDLLEQIRRVDSDLAIIIVTGYPSVETATSCISHDVSAYLQKPFGIEEFRAVVERIVRRKGLATSKEEELHRTIGRQIRELRTAQGLTLKQLARRTQLSVSLLSQIERAESSASVASLFKVAVALDVRMTELFGPF